jgi:signal recognition particle subunit SEC65
MEYDVDLSLVLNKLLPGSKWILRGNSYDGIEWCEPPVWEGGIKKPTKEEVEAVVEELLIEKQSTQHQRLREKEYPDFREYLDGIVKGDQEQIQAYIDKCLAVKAKYPKPEGVE